MQRRLASPDSPKCDRPSCWESPCQHGPCPKDPDPNDDVDAGERHRMLSNKFLKKDPTKLYMTDRESMERVGGFAKGHQVWSSVKRDGINVQVIRVGRFMYSLTSGGMVLHAVMLANQFDTRAFPDGASVRAELVVECEGYHNYDCWEATMREFIHSRAYTSVHDLGTKKPHFTRMDAKPQWTASGKRGHPRIHLHVFGLATRGTSIPDARIALMLSNCHENISAVPWTRASSAEELLGRMNEVWQKGLEGLIVRIVDDGHDAEGGSRTGSPNPDHHIVRYAKAKPTFQCDAVVEIIRRHVPLVTLQATRFIDSREVHVRLGYTRGWLPGDNVLVYCIPKFCGDRKMRHIVGIGEKSRKRVSASPDPEAAGAPEKQKSPGSAGPPSPDAPEKWHSSGSDGPPSPNAQYLVPTFGFCHYCDELVAKDSEWGRDGDIYHHRACRPPGEPREA